MSSMCIQSRRIYTAEGLTSGALAVVDGRIDAIGAVCCGQDCPTVDYGNLRVIPGIIDLHNHGFGGIDIMIPFDPAQPEQSWMHGNDDPTAVLQYTKALPSVGVTGVLPTTNAFEAVRAAIERGRQGARILGIHSEGPFMNPGMMGAGTRADGKTPDLPKPSVAAIAALYERAGGHLRYMTIAPETVEDRAVFAYMRAHNIVIAAGHTDATYAQFMQGVADGVRSSVHTGNVMRPIDRREAGALGAALLCEDIFCELIADFIHVCPETIRIMFKVKDPEKFMLVSDSSQLTGMAPGVYDMLGTKVTVTPDGRALTEIGRLAGSCRSVIHGVANLVERLGVPLETVLHMTGRNPAAILGIADRKGTLAPGMDADCVVIDDDYNVVATYVEGELVYARA